MLTTRRLTELDAESVKAIEQKTDLTVSEWLDTEDGAWGIFEGEKLLGYCSMGYADDCGPEIENFTGWNNDCLILSNVFIEETYRHQGLGSKMLKDVIKLHPEAKDNLVFLTMIHMGLKNFYKKIGFNAIDDRDYAMFRYC